MSFRPKSQGQIHRQTHGLPSTCIRSKFYYRIQVGWIFEFVELLLFLKNYLGGVLAPSSQMVGYLLIPLANKASGVNDMSIAPMDLIQKLNRLRQYHFFNSSLQRVIYSYIVKEFLGLNQVYYWGFRTNTQTNINS